MAKPTPSPQQIEVLQAEKAKAEATAALFTAQDAAKAAREAELNVLDSAFKDLFDWYNDKVIVKYDTEKKAINGVFQATPIVEADLTACANLSGRLLPTPPATAPVRIAEFDGGNTSTSVVNELQHITDQAVIEDYLVNGFSPTPTFNPATAETDSALTPASTTLDVTDPTNVMSFAIGQFLVIKGLSEIAVIKITSVTPGVGVPPPYDFTLGFTYIVAPVGTIAIGAELDNFTGFTNPERTTKTASDADFQPLMDYLIAQLQLHLNNRKARIVEMNAALSTNEDPTPAAITNIANQTTANNNTTTFINNYLVTTDISDTGLSSLSTERGTRTTNLNGRVTQINAAYTGGQENFYDARYTQASNRADTSRGTLRQAIVANQSRATSAQYAAGATASAATYGSILP